MPVHFYIPTFAGGGAERFFVRLANEMAATGRPTHLIVNNESGPLRGLLSERVTLHVLGVSKAVLGLPRLVSYLRACQAKVLISALTRTNLIALISAQLARTGTKVIVCERNQYTALAKEMDPVRRTIINLLVRVYYPRAHAVIGNTQGVTDDIAQFARLPASQTVVIHNAAPDQQQFDEARAAPVIHPWFEEEARVAVAVGRLMPQKDYRTMLRAVALASDDLRLVILGDGPEREALESYAKECGILDRVAFMGFRMDRFHYLVQADLFLLSSITEGFPNALIEAVAAGIPSISTDCLGGGPREIIGREFPERLVPIQDPEAMASAIRDLLASRDTETLAREKADIAAIAKRYDLSEIANAFLESARS